MPASPDIPQAFFDRADAVIALANRQVGQGQPRGDVSASTLYAAARFNAFTTAAAHRSAEGLAADKAEALDYFTAQYRAMLEENLDDYVAHFDRYVRA